MTTEVRAPTSDDAVTGTWSGSAGTRYTLVDDYPDSAGSDSLTCTALSGGVGRATFGFSAFSVPTGAVITQVVVRYYDSKAGSQAAAAGSSLKVGGSYYNSATHNPSNGSWVIRSDTWTTNPATSAAWTVAQINGTAGSNNLQAFGAYTSDTTPNISWSSVQIDVVYSDPATGTITSTLADITASVQGKVDNKGTLASTLADVTASFSGDISVVEQGGYFSLLFLEAGGAGSIDTSSTFDGVLAGDSAAFSGTVTNNGTFTPTLAGVSSSFTGDVAADNATFYSLFWLEAGGAGLVTLPTGTFAATLDNVTGSFTGSLLDAGSVAATLDGVTSNFAGFVGNTFGGFRSMFFLDGGGAYAIPAEPFRIQPYEDGVPQAWYADPGYASTYVYEEFGITISKRDVVGAISGEFASTLGSDYSFISGLVSQNVYGTIAPTLDNIVASIVGAAGSPEGTIAATLRDDVFDISGKTTVAGPVDSVFAGVTMTSSGNILNRGTIEVTLSNDVMSFNGYWAQHVTGTFGSTLVGVTNTDPPKPPTRIFIGALSISI